MTLKNISAILLLVTIALAMLKEPTVTHRQASPQADGVFRVSFEEIQIGGRATGKMRHDASLGTEFKVSVWGLERARIAMDGVRYWFWIKDYDSKRHYESPIESVRDTDLIPPLRPSFIIWITNDRSPKDPSKFKDGDYDIELEVRHGSVTKQTYTRKGVVEAKVVVKAFQRSSGREFPALATLYINGNLIDINMGLADTTNPNRPNTNPPEWSKAARIDN